MTDADLFERAADNRLSETEAQEFKVRLLDDEQFAREWLLFIHDEAIIRETMPALARVRQQAERTRALEHDRGWRWIWSGRQWVRRFLGQPIGWITIVAALAAFCSFCFWPRSSQQPSYPAIEIGEVRDSVEIISQGEPRPATSGVHLAPGDIIKSHEHGGTSLRFADGSSLQMKVESVLHLAAAKQSGTVEINLEHGELKVNTTTLSAKAPQVSFSTHEAFIEAPGAEFTLAEQGNHTDLAVHRGEARVTRLKDSANALVAAGNSLRVETGLKLSPIAFSKPMPQLQRLLWRIGVDDLTHDEFGDQLPPRFEVPANWEKRGTWSEFGWRVNKANSNVDLVFHLNTVPRYGAEFSFRTLNAAPENGGIPAGLTIFANGTCAGLVQTWKAPKLANDEVTFRMVYRLYIPPELLHAGENELRLALAAHPYSTVRDHLEIEWDYLTLAELLAPAPEPIHGRMAYLGSYADHDASEFIIDDDLVRHMPALLEWMGIAYSGNTMRVTFWKGRENVQPARRAYLEKLRDLNMGACVSASGPEDYIRGIYRDYGNLFQYHEIGSSPEMIGTHTEEEMVAGAREAQQIKAENPSTTHVKVSAPGWSFLKWGADSSNRRAVEQYCDATNGHDYGDSFAFELGGHFTNALRTYGGIVNDGLPKEWISTECGTENGNLSPEWFIPPSKKRSSSFDRNMRAHIAVIDRTMQHAMFLHDKARDANCSLFAPITEWKTHDPADTEADAPLDEGGTRLQIFRRIALAYTTHGRPLSYEILNAEENRYQKVYFRAVDTSTLAPLPGSGAHANKILLSFVNFEEAPKTMHVRVHLPQSAHYAGRRVGPGTKYRDAVTSVEIDASPAYDFDVPLAPLESVEYILEQK